MQKIMVILFGFSAAFHSYAGGGLKQIIQEADTATSFGTYHRLAQQSEIIVTNESSNWLAYYWCSFNYAAAAYVAPRDSRDQLLDKAQTMLNYASSMKKNEAEILLLQSWIYTTRVTVAPGSRVKEYGPKATEAREQAYSIDPHNPRYYFLKGSTMYFMPPAFGGGKDKAKPLFEQSIEKYQSYPSKGEFYPQWGKKQAQELLEACN